MTLDEFRSSKPHATALAAFLASETGQALQSVLTTESPAKALGRSQVRHSGASTLRGKAAAETVHAESAANLLGTVGGYEQALAVLELAAIFAPPSPPKQSRKGGAPTLPEPQPPA